MALSTRHARANAIVLGFTAFATLGVGALVQLNEGDLLLSAGLSLRVALGLLLAGWMMYFVPGAVKLNTPFTARLVPRMRRRLIELTTLPLVGANLRKHARHAGLLGWLFGAAGLVLQRMLGLPLTAGAALASLLIALAVVAAGFARGKVAPFAFPAGRLA
jgi:hypothetical protein